MVQFLWQDNLVSVSKFLCKCVDVMLGADSDDQSLISPGWLERCNPLTD